MIYDLWWGKSSGKEAWNNIPQIDYNKSCRKPENQTSHSEPTQDLRGHDISRIPDTGVACRI